MLNIVYANRKKGFVKFLTLLWWMVWHNSILHVFGLAQHRSMKYLHREVVNLSVQRQRLQILLISFPSVFFFINNKSSVDNFVSLRHSKHTNDVRVYWTSRYNARLTEVSLACRFFFLSTLPLFSCSNYGSVQPVCKKSGRVCSSGSAPASEITITSTHVPINPGFCIKTHFLWKENILLWNYVNF